MTCMIACVGLLPAALSSGIGSQVQKPLAIVVVGGMVFAHFLILVILPVLVFSRRRALYPPSPTAPIEQELAG
jgi:cobalt-zinc-cadmium resistance protein CzcA